MKKFTKTLGLILALAMLMSSVASVALAEPRNLILGTWWDQYYDSTHSALEDDPSYSGSLSAEYRFDNVKKLEDRYNITYEFQNMTYTGVKESVNTSILAGTPDCDLYQVELTWAASAVMNGYATDLRDILPADDPLLTHEDPYVNWVDVGNGAVSLLYPVSAEDTVANSNPLAFNLQMIQDAGLEDPRELVARGEWTWDKFREYCLALTKDLDGDGVTDQYGFSGWVGDVFKELIMSNGASIAPFGSTEEQLTSAATGEVLQFMQDLYLVDKVWKPIPDENGWDVSRFDYSANNVGFTYIAVWIMDSNGDFKDGNALPFDLVFIPWPTGPSGNAETNAGKMVAGNYWMIPAGIEDPLMLYNFFRDYCNWYEGDIELRDDPDTMWWWYSSTAKDVELQNANFDVLTQLGSRIQADNMNNLGFDFPLLDLLKGDYTVAQLQETYKQQVTDAMVRLAGK